MIERLEGMKMNDLLLGLSVMTIGIILVGAFILWLEFSANNKKKQS